MRFVAVDWGTSRLRAFLVEDGTVLARAGSDDGIARLGAGLHAEALNRVCGAWLAAEAGLRVGLVGMVGSREGWFPAPYAECPAGPAEIAAALQPVALQEGRTGFVVPGVRFDAGSGVDVMRGEETHLIGSGVRDGLVCLPGTHCKWAEMTGGRISRFATFMTGEMHALLRQHWMIGRPATDPADPAGFTSGLAASASAGDRGGGLLNLLFGARAAAVTGRLSPDALGPYLSGLLTGEEVAGAFRLFGAPCRVTVVAEPSRAVLYEEALGSHGTVVDRLDPEATLVAGLARIFAADGSAT